MTYVVSDTSILIDLERGGLMRPCLQLPFGFAVPDKLYNDELADYRGPEWLECGLQIIELDSGEVSLAQQVLNERRKLSVVDAYAYSLASNRQWMLLSGDGELRDLADQNNVTCNGVLWVTDEIFTAEIMNNEELASALEAIGKHPRCRLPKLEIKTRLERYRDTTA
ncbi:MAG: hypothetical protein HY242_01660 [Afipia sp.]|nr:hypothetical protein [Afipia sp.]